MKKMKKYLMGVLSGVIALSSFVLPCVTASAGTSTVNIVKTEYFEENLSSSYFYSTSGVVSKDGQIVFTDKSTKNTFLNAKSRVNNLAENGIEDCIDLSTQMKVSSIEQGKKWGYSFGLDKMYSKSFTANTTFVYILNDSGTYKYGIENYNKTAKAQTILEPTEFPKGFFAVDKNFIFSIVIKSDGAISLKSDGVELYNNKDANCFTEGYFGLAQTGNSQLAITKLTVTGTYYEVAENAGMITEDFDDGEFNKNLWSCTGHNGYLQPSSLSITDGVFRFENTSEGIFTTNHMYSNFQLDFDITDIVREAVWNEDGSLKYPISSWIGIAFGRTNNNMSSGDAVKQTPMIRFEANRSDYVTPAKSTTAVLSSYGRVVRNVTMSGDRNLWGEEVVNNRSYNVRIKMVDGLCELFGKFEDEETYTRLISYELGYTPLGYIQFWSMGFADFTTGTYAPGDIMQGNFSIDNIVLQNLDVNPNIIQVDFVSNIPKVPADYEYVDPWNDAYLLENTLTDETIKIEKETVTKGCYSQISLGGISGMCIVVGLALVALKKEKKHEN